jgi:uncharacterized damage-inducible protein DinB
MPSIPRDHLVRRLAYHHWAGDKAFEAVSALTAEQLDRPFGGSFGTGRALLRHVVGVERLWLDRFHGNSPKGLPEFPASWSGQDYRDEWIRVKPEQTKYLQSLTADALAGPLTYTNIKGETWSYQLSDILEHLVNHGTYHRGQITHLLRTMGLAAPTTDFLFFCEGKQG